MPSKTSRSFCFYIWFWFLLFLLFLYCFMGFVFYLDSILVSFFNCIMGLFLVFFVLLCAHVWEYPIKALSRLRHWHLGIIEIGDDFFLKPQPKLGEFWRVPKIFPWRLGIASFVPKHLLLWRKETVTIRYIRKLRQNANIAMKKWKKVSCHYMSVKVTRKLPALYAG